MPSQLTFTATESLRNSLLGRNLRPYNKQNSGTVYPSRTQYQPNYSNVVDSPDILIDRSPYSKNLNVLNQFGPDGGYNYDISDINTTLQNKPNEGPYGPYPPYTNELQAYSQTFQTKSRIKNEYSPRDGYQYYDVGDFVRVQKNSSYWDPPSFRPSTYSPYSILLSNVPVGSNGSILEDSELAQLGAQSLQQLFKDTIDRNLETETTGRLNILNGSKDPVNLALIVSGKRPLAFSDWKITAGGDIGARAQSLVQRIAGFTFPSSPIPGDILPTRTFNSTQSAVIAADDGRRGSVFGLFGTRPTNPSQLLLDYTGKGQREQLTNSLVFNRFRPKYNTGGTGVLSAIGQAIFGGFGDDLGEGLYYVGSPMNEPGYMKSPPGEVPINEFGEQVIAPVYGPDVLGIAYEGNDLTDRFQFGFRGENYIDQGNLMGGFTWMKEEFIPEAGKGVGPNGTLSKEDEDFPMISNDFFDSQSSDFDFKPGSILFDTQRLIDSTPKGGARYKHVGNAINQTSKIFNDGYKQITKGSRVLRYTPELENRVIEYCRVFTKDRPYLSFTDLQKSDGNIRKMDYSVLNNTFNVNIAPEKGGTSTYANGKAKKYMFSIENLAWRTSSRPNLTYESLPKCEQGPNGGRIMWFPPYDLEFSESIRPDFTPTTFLGRPEPVYTYKNTTRGGNLKWKIIVDHPSIMNLIAQKVLENKTNTEADQILNSFLAGCKKYDLYELAAIYNTVPLDQLQSTIRILNEPNITDEIYSEAYTSLIPDPQNISLEIPQQPPTPSLEEYQNFGFYFDNDVPPKSGEISNYETYYSLYVTQSNKDKYERLATTNQKGPVSEFFPKVVESNFLKTKELCEKIIKILTEDSTATIKMEIVSFASSPGTIAYNKSLSERRNTSVLKFFEAFSSASGKQLKDFIGSRLTITSIAEGEEGPPTQPKYIDNTMGQSVSCGENLLGNSKIYSYNAMACRVTKIKTISVTSNPIQPQPSNNNPNITLIDDGKQPSAPKKEKEPQSFTEKISSKGATKKILRMLLSECDYFEVLKDTDFFLYNSLKNKLKYFSPAFHSMTPEGLNARLTFLQQCMRPGDTIPTIGPDGQKIMNEALNTAFGAPPVLVIRVGDFYNTKIIPTNLSLQYEKNLIDMNPEGIGLQPMIVTVSLDFNFIGGSGLKDPIDTLQNALSFNYYANTEVYDERAEETDTSLNKLDEQIIQKIQNLQPLVGVNNTDKNPKVLFGETIGQIEQSGQTVSGITGELKYEKIYNDLIQQTQKYFTTTLSFYQNILNVYGYGLIPMLSSIRGTLFNDNSNPQPTPGPNRSYNLGKIVGVDTQIYGKPALYCDNIRWAFKSLNEYIDNEVIGIFKTYTPQGNSYTTGPGEMDTITITQPQKNIFKENYKRFLQGYEQTFQNKLTEFIQPLITEQQNLVFIIDKLNFVYQNNSDGVVKSPNEVEIYELTQQLPNYLQIIQQNLQNFIDTQDVYGLYSDNRYQYPSSGNFDTSGLTGFSALVSPEQKTEYFLMSKLLSDNNEARQFLIDLTANLDTFTKQIVTNYYSNFLKNVYDGCNTAGKNLLVKYKEELGKPFVIYTPEIDTNNVKASFQQTLPNLPLEQSLRDLFAAKNDTESYNPFNLKKKFN